MVNYPIGVLLGVTAGICLNTGFVLQKKAVNEIPPEKREAKLIGTLIRTPVWVGGLIVQILGSAVLVMIAQFFIGPALLPGLMAGGLVVMALGAARILGETLERTEIIGIGTMIGAIVLVAFSGLSVDVTSQNLLDQGFLTRVTVFTVILAGLVVACELLQGRSDKIKPLALALQSGAFLALANFWVSPFSVNLGHLFAGTLDVPNELVLGTIGGGILAVTNVMAIASLQKAFSHGRASTVVPLQQVPITVAPVFVYFGIFSLAPPTTHAIPLMVAGIALILVSAYLLGRRQAQLEEIN